MTTINKAEERIDQLLKLAAEAMADGRDPFSEPFLGENGVTINEIYQMGDLIASIVKGYLNSGSLERLTILTCGSDIGAGRSEYVWNAYRLNSDLPARKGPRQE